MTFKNCVENFPLNDTLVGNYNSDQSFSISVGESVDNIEKWRDNPFWEDNSSYAFVTYEPFDNEFTCWSFLFDRVKGYLNETDDPDNFYPATYSEDFGWTKIDPFDPRLEDQVTLPDDELAMQLGWPLEELTTDKYRREQVAYLFDVESYLNGYTFTSPEAIKKFVKSKNFRMNAE